MTLLISIHALHEESDERAYQQQHEGLDISIHALHEESDRFLRMSLRTRAISIHALHEESDFLRYGELAIGCGPISIHALHEESDSSTRQ